MGFGIRVRDWGFGMTIWGSYRVLGGGSGGPEGFGIWASGLRLLVRANRCFLGGFWGFGFNGVSFGLRGWTYNLLFQRCGFRCLVCRGRGFRN